MWPGAHYVWHAMIDGKRMSRKYTPIDAVNKKGKSTFVIKIYRNNKDFPEGGKFTQYLENKVNVGDSIMCEGPIGRLKYLGYGKIEVGKKQLMKKRICLLAGGSGVTPLYDIALAASLANDGIEIWFMFSNKSKGDILIKE